MAKHRGEITEGIRSHGTDVGGDCYIHPRSNEYRKNFDKIKWDDPDPIPVDCKCEGCNGTNCCRKKQEVSGEASEQSS